MANNARTQADGTWVDGYTPPASDWEDLERKVFGSWNGDKGGAYCAPRTGDAYTFDSSGLQVTGPTRLTRGGVIYGASTAFVIRDGTWPTLGETHAGRTRRIVQPISSYQTSRNYLWSRNHAYAGVGSVALACRRTDARSTIETADLYIPLRVIDGSTLSSVDLNFRVATKRLRAPIAMPKLRIMRIPHVTGEVPEPLKDTTDGLGFDFLPLVTTPTAWYADGAVQTFTYVCDQNNEIDVENYSYVAHLVEEQGAVTPDDEFDGVCFVERKVSAYVTLTGANALTGSINTEGTSTSAGYRILVVDSDATLATGEPEGSGYSAQNGIWIAAAGAWARATDLDEAADFTPNWIIVPSYGTVNGGAAWQCVTAATHLNLKAAAGASLAYTGITIQPAQPKGNIYHSLVPTFEVTDLRFQ